MKSIYVASPSLGSLHVGLAKWLLGQALRNRYKLTWDTPCELRGIDWARNFCAQKFLETDCDYLAFVDSDVVPHERFLDLVELNKPIVAGNTFCFRQGDLMPSIWQRAECEECRNREHFKRTGRILDASMFKCSESGTLLVWNPFNSVWNVAVEDECRCKGTNRDPWVYRIHERSSEPPRGPFQCDAAGGATLIIHRDVFEKLSQSPFGLSQDSTKEAKSRVQWPFFRFLYKESMEQLLAEDLYFCWRAKEAGFEIWADLEIASRHWKQIDLLEMNSLVAKGYQGGVLAGQESRKRENKLIVPGYASIGN